MFGYPSENGTGGGGGATANNMNNNNNINNNNNSSNGGFSLGRSSSAASNLSRTGRSPTLGQHSAFSNGSSAAASSSSQQGNRLTQYLKQKNLNRLNGVGAGGGMPCSNLRGFSSTMSISDASQAAAHGGGLMNATFHPMSQQQQPQQNHPPNGFNPLRSSASTPVIRGRNVGSGVPSSSSSGSGEGGAGMGNASFDIDQLNMRSPSTASNLLLQYTQKSLSRGLSNNNYTNIQNKRMRRAASDLTTLGHTPGGASGSQQQNAVFAMQQPLTNNHTNNPYRGNLFTSTFQPIHEDPSFSKMQIAAMDNDSLLHNSCKLYPHDFEIVESALQLDPGAIRRKIPIVCTRGGAAANANSSAVPGGHREAPKKYCYPINIALQYGAAVPIVQLLASAGPDVLVQPDGPNNQTSLLIAIACAETQPTTIEILLNANPECAMIADRHSNTALHGAARSCRDLATVVRIHNAYPAALQKRNFHGDTPLDIAVRLPTCPEPILQYLQKKSFDYLEDENVRSMDLL